MLIVAAIERGYRHVLGSERFETLCELLGKIQE